jgi:hypothetical protein
MGETQHNSPRLPSFTQTQYFTVAHSSMGETQHKSPRLPSFTQTQYFSVAHSSIGGNTAQVLIKLGTNIAQTSMGGNTTQFPKAAKLNSDSIFFCGPQFNLNILTV